MAIFNVIGHHHLFYTFNTENIAFNDEVLIAGRIERVLGGEPADYVRVRLSQVGETDYGYFLTPFANISIKHTTKEIQQGLQFQGKAKLRLFRGRKNLSGFDSELFAFKNKIIFKGRVNKLELVSSKKFGIFHTYRNLVWQNFEDLELGWLYYTLLTGDKSKIESTDYEAMRTLGLSHLMAISGLHIGIIFALSFCIAKSICWLFLSVTRFDCAQQYHLRIAYALFALVIAFLYVYISGMSVSATRAYSMFFLVTLVYFLKKDINKPRLLLLAASITLLLDPFVLLNVGWYFSFIAVSAIFIAVVQINPIPVNSLNWLAQLIKVQFYIAILLAPLSMFVFHGVSLAGLFTNLFAIPLLSFVIFPFMLLGLTFSFIDSSASILQFFDGFFAWLLTSALRIAGSNGWWDSGKIELVSLLFIYSVIMFVFFRPLRRLVWWPFVLYSAFKLSNDEPTWEIDVFDVGHGTSVLVTSQGKGLLYDLGAKYFDRYAIFEHVVQPYIEENDIELTHTILSHQDKDHIGGVDELYKFDNFASLHEFHTGDAHSHCELKLIKLNNLSIETLWPISDLGSKNNNSCVVKVSDGKLSFLLPGDIEHRAEKKLMAHYPSDKLESTILLAPHHGSKTSSSIAFIRAVNPKIAIFSRSYYSQWKLPHYEVVQRYKDLDITQLDTAINGHIKIKIYDDDLVISTARATRGFWFLGNILSNSEHISD